MTVANPFTLTGATTAETTNATQLRDDASTPVTPYTALCADGTRPAAFTMTFCEPAAA